MYYTKHLEWKENNFFFYEVESATNSHDARGVLKEGGVLSCQSGEDKYVIL